MPIGMLAPCKEGVPDCVQLFRGCVEGVPLPRACAGAQIGVLAKVESADSVGNLEDILDAVDGAMVARGDLGAELPVEEVRRRSLRMYVL